VFAVGVPEGPDRFLMAVVEWEDEPGECRSHDDTDVVILSAWPDGLEESGVRHFTDIASEEEEIPPLDR